MAATLQRKASGGKIITKEIAPRNYWLSQRGNRKSLAIAIVRFWCAKLAWKGLDAKHPRK